MFLLSLGFSVMLGITSYYVLNLEKVPQNKLELGDCVQKKGKDYKEKIVDINSDGVVFTRYIVGIFQQSDAYGIERQKLLTKVECD